MLAEASAAICERVGPSGQVVLVDMARETPRNSHKGRAPWKYHHWKNRDTRIAGNEGNDSTTSYKDRATFVEVDHFEEWRSALHLTRDHMCNTSSATGARDPPRLFNALVVDVGPMVGNDLALTSVALVQEFLAQQKQMQQQSGCPGQSVYPRVVLLKSPSLSALARRLVHVSRILDGTQSFPRPDELVRTHQPHLIATVGVEEYRKTIPHVVARGDAVLEVGCHFGTSTRLLHEAAGGPKKQEQQDNKVTQGKRGFCIGVDIGHRIISHAKREHPQIPFAVGDAWRTAELSRFRHDLLPCQGNSAGEIGYDVVYADIGGLSGPDGLLESLALLESLGYALEPRCIVIKSLCMQRLASSLRAFSDVWLRQRSAQKSGGYACE